LISPIRLRAKLLTVLALTVVGLLCWFAYLPGLRSGFLFDDAANLPVLGSYGRIDSIDRLLRYLTSGIADPTGRPLSLLSFLIDANDWPAASFPFKRTNLLIHLINGALLYALLRRLGALVGLNAYKERLAAAFGASAWLLHPLFVSTVLYIVQREAMLPALFVLLGLHGWLYARSRILAGRRGGIACLAAVIFGTTALAFLSKPNGLLLPLLVLVVEGCLRSSTSVRAPTYRRWLLVTAGPIAALVVAGLTWVALRSIGSGVIEGRDFSTVQRLLTEPTVLLDYLRLLFLLDPHYGSLFHDQYRAANGPLSPWWTLPAILACVAACAGAWCIRPRFPALAAATLFFFAGHLVESSSLALELYFEHRNYLPSLLLFWPVGVALSGIRWRPLGFTLAILLASGLAALTFATARMWGNPLERAEVWADEAPASPRAQAYAAQVEAEHGRLARAVARINDAVGKFPLEPQIAFTMLDMHCLQGALQPGDETLAARALREAPRDPGALLAQWVGSAVETAASGRCRGLTQAVLIQLLDAAAANPQVAGLPGRMQDIAHLRGVIALKGGDADQALRWFAEALSRDPSTAVALDQAARLGAAGHPRAGLDHLDFYQSLEVPPVRPTRGMPWLHALLLDHQGYWPTELAALRATLVNDARKREP
jgi:tetratricopeptide (TPR) repeat protein